MNLVCKVGQDYSLMVIKEWLEKCKNVFKHKWMILKTREVILIKILTLETSFGKNNHLDTFHENKWFKCAS